MKTLLYCNCSRAGLISDPVRTAVLAALDHAGVEYLYTDDLCGLCADSGQILPASISGDALVVLACFPRTINALLNRAGGDRRPTPQTLNLREGAPETITKQLDIENTRPGTRITLKPGNAAWEPWYPLIDHDRCKQCKQCLNFCLFGVYALDARQTVQVAQPTHCKTGCPACARVCPFAAIIFPKYDKAPINGDAVDEQAWKNTPPPADLQQRLRGNVMSMLRGRSAAASPDSLEQMKHQLDIPDSVIENLKKEKHG